jgi:hypothetical protein
MCSESGEEQTSRRVRPASAIQPVGNGPSRSKGKLAEPTARVVANPATLWSHDSPRTFVLRKVGMHHRAPSVSPAWIQAVKRLERGINPQYQSWTLSRVTIAIGFRPLVEERSGASSIEAFAFGSAPANSSCETPAASGWVLGSHKCIFVRKRGDKWFFTSLCLTLLIAAPVDGLLVSRALVWSNTWNAKGEKGKTRCALRIR